MNIRRTTLTLIIEIDVDPANAGVDLIETEIRGALCDLSDSKHPDWSIEDLVFDFPELTDYDAVDQG